MTHEPGVSELLVSEWSTRAASGEHGDMEAEESGLFVPVRLLPFSEGRAFVDWRGCIGLDPDGIALRFA